MNSIPSPWRKRYNKLRPIPTGNFLFTYCKLPSWNLSTDFKFRNSAGNLLTTSITSISTSICLPCLLKLPPLKLPLSPNRPPITSRPGCLPVILLLRLGNLQSAITTNPRSNQKWGKLKAINLNNFWRRRNRPIPSHLPKHPSRKRWFSRRSQKEWK